MKLLALETKLGMLTVKFRQEPENRSIMHDGKKGLVEVGA